MEVTQAALQVSRPYKIVQNIPELTGYTSVPFLKSTKDELYLTKDEVSDTEGPTESISSISF